MKASDLPRYGLTVAFIVLILVLIFTQLIGQPAIVFVESGSMEPTLEVNDGFLAVPSIFVSDIEKGDVIVYEAQEIGGGGLTTHRVVGETERGYITKGDANPFTDQAGGEPPVTEGQIKAVAVQVNGNLVVIPGLGATVAAISEATGAFQRRLFTALGLEAPGVSTFSVGILGVGLLVLLYSIVVGSADARSRKRSEGSVLRNGLVIVAILTLVVIIPVNFSMLLPSGVYQYDIISSENPSEQRRVIRAGGSTEVTYFMRNSGHLPVLVFLEPASPGVEIPEDRTRTYVPRRTTVNVTVTLHAPEETGAYPRYIREYRYLVVLPPSLITALHRVHPFLAIAGINVFVAAVMVVIGVTSVGTERVRFRSRTRELPLREELVRRFAPIRLDRIVGPPGDGPRRSAPIRPPRGERIRPPAPPEDSTDDGPTSGPTGAASPERLTDRQLEAVDAALRRPPSDAGLDSPRWTPRALQEHLEAEYGIEYSLVRCSWLLERAGLAPERADNDGGSGPGEVE